MAIGPGEHKPVSFGDTMASDNANDVKAHNRTYESFIALLKWSIPLIAFITAVVVILIAS